MGDASNLEVYVRAMRLGRQAYADVSTWAPFDQWTLGAQLVRACDSIAANTIEGYGRQTKRERRRFLYIARGSARETECLLEKAIERDLPTTTGHGKMRDEALVITKMLSRLIASIR